MTKRNALTGTNQYTENVTRVSTTDGWGEKVRQEVVAETTADAEAALDRRRRGAIDPPVGNRELLAAAQARLKTLMDEGLDGLPGR